MSIANRPRLTVTGPVGATSTVGPATPRTVGWLASPLGMAVVIPLLVLLTGGAIALVMRFELLGLTETRTNELITQHTTQMSLALSRNLEQAGPMLDSLLHAAGVLDLSDDAACARTLGAVLRGRRGAVMVMIATSSGGFRAALSVGDRQVRFRRSDVQPDGTSPQTLWMVDTAGVLADAATQADAGYDPRRRPFWATATQAATRAWTPPYAFFANGTTGVTCAEPIRLADGTQGVVAVDFDLAALGYSLARLEAKQETLPFAFTPERVVVAAPDEVEAASPREKGQLLDATTVKHPAVKAFFAALEREPTLPALGDPPRLLAIDPDHVATLRAVDAGAGRWFTGLIIPRDFLYGPVERAKVRSLIGVAIAIAIGVAAGLFFAIHLARSRAETARQRTRAKAAEQRVRELGSYRLVRQLGEGGMGQVWLAEHSLLARPAAVKLIQPHALTGDGRTVEEAKGRFEQEARITAALRSRHTIELYDYGVAPDGTFYYVMELMDGLDLRQLVERHGRQPLGRVVAILRAACQSLGEAHDRGLVHRDIKPENIYLCRRADEVDIVKVLDFGLARTTQRASGQAGLTQAGMIQGTPYTMSPEQIEERALDGRSDLYSLACVAMWLLTGQEVFEGESVMGILMMHLK